jgi:hypothetical protein
MNEREKKRPHIRNSGTIITGLRYRIMRTPHKDCEYCGKNPDPAIIVIPLVPVRLGTKLSMSSSHTVCGARVLP